MNTHNDAAAPATRALSEAPVRFGRARVATLAAAVALALLVRAPALGAPLMLDDDAQHAMTEGRYPTSMGLPGMAPDDRSETGPFDLYDFINDSNRAALLERGIIPWWTHPKLVVRFFRPLASALLWADYRVFGRHTFWHHLHSILWWGLATLAVQALLRRLLPQRAARLGTAVFAFAPCHAVPVVWLANREVLVATALGTAALAVYAQWREGRRPRDGVVSFALFSLAMSAGEYALCFAGYVLAIEAVRRRESVLRRAIGIACFAVPAAAYLGARAALGYGARGAGFYHDPLTHLGDYARSAPRRLAVLLGNAWLGVDDVSWGTAAPWALAALVIGMIGLLAVPVARALRRLEPEQRERGTWLLAGSLLSIAPVLAVQPSARLLGVSMVGVSAIVALVIDRAWFPPVQEPRRGAAELTGLVALALAFAHFVRAPVDTWLATRLAKHNAIAFDERMAWVGDHAAGKSTIVVLRASSPPSTLFAPLVLGDAAPERWRILTFLSGHCLLLRTTERALEIVAGKVPLFPVGSDDLFRDIDPPLRPGDEVRIGGMNVTVMQVDEHSAARRVRFEFDRDLDDPSMLWLTEDSAGFQEHTLPAKGYGEPIGR